MAKCIICGEKMKKEYNKVCPGCGRVFLKHHSAIKFEGIKKKYSANLYFAENRFKYVINSGNVAMGQASFGLIGAAIGAAIDSARNKDINTVCVIEKGQIASIEYPTVEKGFGKEKAIRIVFKDGGSIIFGWGGKKKVAATYALLSEVYAAPVEEAAPIEEDIPAE